ncbi:hypothetical protein [Azospirillum sp. sgz301742]
MNVQEWHVYFVTATTPGWWSWVFPKGRQHCFAAARLGPDQWMVTESAQRGIEVDILDDAGMAGVHAHAMQALDGTVFVVANDEKRRGQYGWPLHCASYLAHLLGVKPWRALTPPQFFRTLEKEARRGGH